MDVNRTQILDARLFAMGVVLLLVGIMFYVLVRTEPVAFMHWTGISPASAALPINGAGWLPSFVHAAAFTLLTAAWLERRAACVLAAAAGWFVINAMFEFLQLLPTSVSAELPRVLANFASSGTFDPRDIAGAAAGALAAAFVCWIVILPKRGNQTAGPRLKL